MPRVLSVTPARRGGWNVLVEGELKPRWYPTERQARLAERGLNVVAQELRRTATTEFARTAPRDDRGRFLPPEPKMYQLDSDKGVGSARGMWVVEWTGDSGKRETLMCRTRLDAERYWQEARVRYDEDRAQEDVDAAQRIAEIEMAKAARQKLKGTPRSFVRPPNTIPYPDTERWINRFGVPSSDGRRVYIISWDTASQCWVCSCPAGTNRGQCKHLDEYGYVGKPKGAAKPKVPPFPQGVNSRFDSKPAKPKLVSFADAKLLKQAPTSADIERKLAMLDELIEREKQQQKPVPAKPERRAPVRRIVLDDDTI